MRRHLQPVWAVSYKSVKAMVAVGRIPDFAAGELYTGRSQPDRRYKSRYRKIVKCEIYFKRKKTVLLYKPERSFGRQAITEE